MPDPISPNGTDHPRHEPGAPDPPAWLLPAAREHWAELCPMLAGAGIMAEGHTTAPPPPADADDMGSVLRLADQQGDGDE